MLDFTFSKEISPEPVSNLRSCCQPRGVEAGKKESQQMRQRGGGRTQRTSRETMRGENFNSAK